MTCDCISAWVQRLGSARVEITWPNGKREELKDLAADAIYTIVEGKGITKTTALPSVAAAK